VQEDTFALYGDVSHLSFGIDLKAKRLQLQVFVAPKPVAVKVYIIPGEFVLHIELEN